MSILDALSGGLTTATNAATAQQQGQLQGGQLAMALAMRQAEMAKQRAETEAALANAARLRHQNNAPVLGEEGYAPAMGAVKGAEARAEVQPHVDQAVETAAGEAPIKVKTAGDIAQAEVGPHVEQAVKTAEGEVAPHVRQATDIFQNELPGRKELVRERATATALGPAMQRATAKPFLDQTKGLTASVMPYAQAKDAFQEARAGNPAALKSALISYAAVADPKAQLRQGVMNYVTKVDPSFHGTFEMALDRMTSGTLPPGVLDNMEKMVDRLYQTHRAMYDMQRTAFLSRQPLAESFVPTTEELFNVPTVNNPTTAAPNVPKGADVGQHLQSRYGIKLP